MEYLRNTIFNIIFKCEVNMIKKISVIVLSIFMFFLTGFSKDNSINFKNYHNPKEINRFLLDISKNHKDFIKFHKLAVSPGGNPVNLLEIVAGNKNEKNIPAVFVAANFTGTNLISSEAALFLIKELINDPGKRKNKTWYILPLGNPDAAWRYFKKPLYEDHRNNRPHNDDMDDAVDEDGYDDLNGDGFITVMRVRDPEGEYIPVPGNIRLMKKADWSKGEKGIYKLYSEGLDNDKDGKYNEDVPGGVDISINFPHLFKPFLKSGGKWPGSESEVYNLFKFIFSHKEIAMTIDFGESNFCLTPPRGGRKGSVDYSKIKIPKRIAKYFNADPDKTYSMKTIMEMVQKIIPSGMEVTESMVASFLGLGAVINPLKEDLKFYNKISEEYKEFLKKGKVNLKRIDPPKAKDGSFELWSYYHLGLPSFSMDFWTLPKVEKKKSKNPEITPEKLENMSKDDFLALGKEKINAFLKSSGAPKNIKAEFIINAVKGGMMTPKKMAELMKKMLRKKDDEGGTPEELALLSFNDKVLRGNGFVEWKKFHHPVLGDVEIGGKIPFSDVLPPSNLLEGLLKTQVPYVFKLSEKIANIKISNIKVKNLGSGLYSVKAYVTNNGFLPYPTAMGEKNERITPVILTVQGNGIKILEGKKRSSIKSIKGMASKSVKWLIYSANPVKLNIKSLTDNATDDLKVVILGGGK